MFLEMFVCSSDSLSFDYEEADREYAQDKERKSTKESHVTNHVFTTTCNINQRVKLQCRVVIFFCLCLD